MAVTTYRRTWTLDDRAESVWHSLPVDIPADCPGLLVTLTIPPVDGAVIDIGCEGAGGWRGWSGGARQTFAITPDALLPRVVDALTEAGVRHAVLGDEPPADPEPVEFEVQLDVVPASLAKGLEFDHVVLLEPSAVVAGEADHVTGLRRLYVCLTRAVTSLTVLHADALPEELGTP